MLKQRLADPIWENWGAHDQSESDTLPEAAADIGSTADAAGSDRIATSSGARTVSAESPEKEQLDAVDRVFRRGTWAMKAHRKRRFDVAQDQDGKTTGLSTEPLASGLNANYQGDNPNQSADAVAARPF